MALSKIMKRRVISKKISQHSYNNNQSSSSSCSSTPKTITILNSLPRDLLVEVVANIASNSFTDLHNTKLCCKDLLDAAEDNHVFQKVSLDKFPLISWHHREKELFFLKRCLENQNLESLYREGLRECFDKRRIANNNNNNNKGIKLLKLAAQKGHVEARYVCGMILLLCSQDDELMKEGLEHIRFLRKTKCVVKTRIKVEKLVRFMWISSNALLVPRHYETLCRFKSTCKGWRLKSGRWVLLDEDDDCDDVNSCELCRWDHELYIFSKLFNIHQF